MTQPNIHNLQSTPSIAIGILGYGTRLPSSNDLFSLSIHPSIEKLFIFWNQPTNATQNSLHEMQENIPKLYFSYCADNLGSAGGYAQIIKNFESTDTSNFLLLLDCDLQLQPDCLNQLLRAANLFNTQLSRTLFLAYRPKLPEMNDLVSKKQGINRPRPSACVAFHLMNLIKQRRECVSYSESNRVFSIESAPWGGLFIPRAALAKLGLPREDFFLYAEDSELTYRFTQNGGDIFLVPDAEIMDTEAAWNTVGGNISNLRRRVLVLPEIKVFHEVRNRNYIARHYYPGLLLVYWLNKFLLLASAYFIGITNGKFSRALLIHQAINAGEKMAAKEARVK